MQARRLLLAGLSGAERQLREGHLAPSQIRCGGLSSEPGEGAWTFREPGKKPVWKAVAWREACAPIVPSKCLAKEAPSAHKDPEVQLSTPLFALGPGPGSSQRGHPAFGAREFRLSGRAHGLPARSLCQVRPGQSLGNAVDPAPRSTSAPRDAWAEKR